MRFCLPRLYEQSRQKWLQHKSAKDESERGIWYFEILHASYMKVKQNFISFNFIEYSDERKIQDLKLLDIQSRYFDTLV